MRGYFLYREEFLLNILTAQPHTESSTEAMDTDEGQRTTARLIEEADVFLRLLWNQHILP